MCDPVTLSIMSTVVGAIGTAGSAMSAMSAQKKQAENVRIWQQEQRQMREAERIKQEGLHDEAEAARQKGVEALGAENQKTVQSEEEARLGKYLTGEDQNPSQATGTAPVSIADKALTDVSQNAAPEYTSYLGKKINEATKASRERMKALATVQSYGGSYGGLATQNPLALAEAGGGIDQFNNARAGSLNIHQLEKQIPPAQVNATPSPMAALFSTALSLGSQGLGNIAGGAAGAGAAPTTIGDPWAGVRMPTTQLPNYTSMLPTARPVF